MTISGGNAESKATTGIEPVCHSARDRATGVHVDRMFVDPLSARPPSLQARYRTIDDPRIGGQERAGWATYVHISDPHLMKDCPFGPGEVLEASGA